ncbi:MAG: hypothetical protein EPN39_14560 [Chitinophagaceae bacterium]|nr:MAG: hypothetical protein EPN39_14560 [Chitinophagaceae bacterium]
MNAIEIAGEIDKSGNLLLKKPLSIKNKQVKVIILFEEEDVDDKLWLKSLTHNPSFNFLKEEPEIYSKTDGKPFND